MSAADFRTAWRPRGALVLSRFDFQKTGLVAAAVIPPAGIPEAGRELLAAGYFLETLTAVEVQEGLLVTYLFDSFDNPGRLALRVLVAPAQKAPREEWAEPEEPEEPEELELPSLAGVYPGAEWHEREAAEFFGLRFPGNPNPLPLLLDPDFPGPPPLRKTPGENVAALRDLNIFGEAEILDPAWPALAGPAGPKTTGDEAA